MNSAIRMMTIQALLLLGPSGLVGAQEHEHEKPSDPGVHQHESTEGKEGPAHHSSQPLGIPESRNASGTAWQPDSTPMHGLHFSRGDWAIMAHWNFFVGYDDQGSDRGDSEWTAPNWGMLMQSRSTGKGALVFREMLSLDPWTVGREGYPLLLQTGESIDGEPIHDRQHPHDLFMELAAMYTRELSGSTALQLYAAPSGEPALGPVAFPHRASAMSDPLAPLAHHWQDSTHISFGVLTAGILTRKLKIEASWFNGREPDEDRYDFDFRRLDSYSGRVSFNPSENWSFQASYGYLASPEQLEPDVSVHRLTASAAANFPVKDSGDLAVTAVYGRNNSSGEPDTASWLLEANCEVGSRHVVFGRLEHVDKTGADLVLPAPLEEEVFPVKSLVAGYVFRIWNAEDFVLGLGARAAVNFIDNDLEPFYGTKEPAGYMIFLQFHPPGMKHLPPS
jgi:hypothetical protein